MSTRTRTDEAIVLARFPYGESSLVVHLCTQRHGRVHLLAKGAFRPTSGYFAALDLFDTVEVRWIASPGLGLATCSRASVAISRRRLARDLERYRAAEAVLALTGLGAREEAADPALFRLASSTLDALGRSQGEPRVVRLAFEFAFLATMGVGIALTACARCGARPDAPARDGVPFSLADGGRLCARC
ncbi:MAG: DNA repair protein RecO, partial [Planctomycetota bacterium]